MVIWIIGAIVPALVLVAEEGNTAFFRVLLITLSSIGFGCAVAHKVFKIPTKPLGILTIASFNLGLATILIEAPISFGSTPIWFPVALTLTIFFGGMKAGFINMLFYEIVIIYNHYLKIDKDIVLPTNWTLENFQNTMLIDKTFSIFTFYLFIFFLITSKRRIYESLLKAKEGIFKSSKLSEVGKVAGNMAHEINSQLTVINFASQLMEKELQKENPDHQTVLKHLSKINTSSKRMESITKGMKKMSRAGDADPFEEINLKMLIDEVHDFFKSNNKLAETKLTFSGLSDHMIIQGRFTQLSQVFINLINNALDAIEELPEKWIKLEVIEHHDSIEIMVIDCGQGIPEENEEMVFESLFTTKPAEKGTGLGLSIVHSIVEQHNGTLKIDRRFKDSRLTISLPKRLEQAA